MMSLLAGHSHPPEVHEAGELAGELAGAGSLFCVECGYAVSLEVMDSLPECPNCSGSRFRRASIFEQPTVDTATVSVTEGTPGWLDELRDGIEEEGCYLAFRDSEPTLFRVPEGWIRIGRSGAADIRLDDPTVSRRHALVVRTPEGELRALDDRSLNGLFINGEQIDWAPLSDGDELEIGRYRLYVIEA
jgi:hypothetical protein